MGRHGKSLRSEAARRELSLGFEYSGHFYDVPVAVMVVFGWATFESGLFLSWSPTLALAGFQEREGRAQCWLHTIKSFISCFARAYLAVMTFGHRGVPG
jgi:hypothetical protein